MVQVDLNKSNAFTSKYIAFSGPSEKNPMNPSELIINEIKDN